MKQKAREEKLQARQDDYAKMLKERKESCDGFKKPGSVKK